jgi:acyl-coenzyme A synthetase/AMP-(fatty) acid ligase
MPTGDIVSQDKNGYYHYLGRAGDVLKVNGRYVDMTAIEHTIMSYPGVQEAVVVGQQDAVGHTRLRAYVVPETDIKLDSTELGKYVRHNSTDFPREIELVDALPRTENGKVQRYKLRQLM